jgi:hypothetical protein
VLRSPPRRRAADPSGEASYVDRRPCGWISSDADRRRTAVAWAELGYVIGAGMLFPFSDHEITEFPPFRKNGATTFCVGQATAPRLRSKSKKVTQKWSV